MRERTCLPACLAEAQLITVCPMQPALLHITCWSRNMPALPCPPAAKRRRCVQLFSEWYGDILRPRAVQWDRQSAAWRLLLRPACWLPTGCLYL